MKLEAKWCARIPCENVDPSNVHRTIFQERERMDGRKEEHKDNDGVLSEGSIFKAQTTRTV